MDRSNKSAKGICLEPVSHWILRVASQCKSLGPVSSVTQHPLTCTEMQRVTHPLHNRLLITQRIRDRMAHLDLAVKRAVGCCQLRVRSLHGGVR